MSIPTKCIALPKSETGEYILTQYSDGTIEIKLYGDDHNKQVYFKFKGELP